MGKRIKLMIAGSVLAVILVAAAVFVVPKLLHSEENRVTTITKASLEKVLEISDLETLDYTYNSIVDVMDEDGETAKYHVAYEGVVTAGIDFEKINVSVEEDTKTVVITVPEAGVQNVYVDMGTLKYIFEKDRYETETVSQEAYHACGEDLEKKAKKETSLLTIARDNAVEAVNALITPWVEQMDEEYQVEVR